MKANDLNGKRIVIHCEIPIEETDIVERVIERVGEDYEFTNEQINEFIKNEFDLDFIVRTMEPKIR